jgi:hypothetical protein
MVDGSIPDAGWQLIDHHPAIAHWARAAHTLALKTLATRDEPWRCGGTWLVGVDALPNDTSGAVPGAAFPWDALPLTPEPLHQAQLSVIKPGYPQPLPTEAEPAFKYRLNRDAAHLDGLIAQPNGARMMQEPHHWILGLPLNTSDASPLVVWDGSHEIMRSALAKALAQVPPADWGSFDLNPAYQAARRDIFASCSRRPLYVLPGQATLLHRLTLHGVAPWQNDKSAPSEGRIIAYLRPQMASVKDWLLFP